MKGGEILMRESEIYEGNFDPPKRRGRCQYCEKTSKPYWDYESFILSPIETTNSPLDGHCRKRDKGKE